MQKKFTLAVALQLALLTLLTAQDNVGWKRFLFQENANYYTVCANVEAYFKQQISVADRSESAVAGEDEGSEYNQYQAWKWFWSSRVNADGSFPDIRPAGFLRSGPPAAGAAAQRNGQEDCGWQLISQNTCTGGYNGMGRTTSIAFHPTDPAVYYVGSPNGGVWKTTDNGASYAPVSEGLPYNGASNILVDYNDPNVLYLSNGDHSGWWTYSTGIYKSTDGGQNWAPTGLSWSLTQSVAVLKMEMDPQDPSVLMVAASNGLWRTTDGGVTWTKVRDGFYSDVKFLPGNSTTIYAALHDYWGFSQIFRSDNSGATWTNLSGFTFLHNWIRLSVTPANPELLAAVCTYDGKRQFYFSSERGANLGYRSDCPESDILMFSPANPSVLYCGAVNAYRSNDQGATWTKISHWHGGQPEPEIHADQRNINWQPGTQHIFFCNDGGIYRYEEPSQVWTEHSNGLIITQFYRIAVAQTDEMFMIGGTQDNGGRKRVGPGEWESTNGGDAMEVAIDYTNPDILYTTYINGQLYRSMDGWVNDVNYRISNNLPGQTPDHDLTGSWISPYQIDPNNPAALVLGYADVYRTTTRGNFWTKISDNLTGSPDEKLDALAIAPANSNIIYTSNNNKLYKTTNLGGNWSTLNVPNSAPITSITVHPTDPDIVYLTRGGYNGGFKVFRSVDGGGNWTNLSGSLPNVPANCLYLDVEADGSYTLFVGNDLGVWYRRHDMADWVGMNQNLPVTIVSDLELQRASRKLRAGTYGRGIWEYDLNHLPASSFAVCAHESQAQICLPQTFVTTLSANAWQTLDSPVALSIAGLPAGVTAQLSADELQPGETATLTLDCPAGLTEGEYPVALYAVSGGDTARAFVRLTLVSSDFTALKASEPANGASGVSRWPLLRWNGVPDANQYELQLATNPSFEPAAIVQTFTGLKVDSLQWAQALDEGRLYYWRLRPGNECGAGGWTEPHVFATTVRTCIALEATDLPRPISASGTPTVESKITIASSGPIKQVKVKKFKGNHQFFKDLEASLIGPSGTTVRLFKDRCGSYNGNFDLGFDSEAPEAFKCPPPQDGLLYRPEEQLGGFIGQDAFGEWTLQVKDKVISSGGQITAFALEFCSDVALNPPFLVHNNPLTLSPGLNAVVSADLLQADDADTPPEALLYTLLTTPAHGELQLHWNGALKPGDQFTQTDIDNGALRYFNYGTGETADQFRFSVTDGDGGLVAETFHIQPMALHAHDPASALAFTMAPNPATESVRIALTEPLSAGARVQVWNLSGQLLQEENLPAGQLSVTLDLAGMPEGVYLILLQSGKGLGIKKLAVHRGE